MNRILLVTAMTIMLGACSVGGSKDAAASAVGSDDSARVATIVADDAVAKQLAELNDKWRDVVKYSPSLVGEELREYAAVFPEMLSVDTIGQSVQGRPLLMARMGRGKTSVFGLASIHAREYISTVMVMKDIEQMLLCYAQGRNFGEYDVRKIFEECTYYLVPMMNPDGVVIAQDGPDQGCGTSFNDIPIDETSREYGYKSWKANAAGVDLNRNYPQGWKENKRSPEGPNSNEYKGPAPFSEPETKALVAALDKTKPVAVISYHTQGEILYISDPTPLDKELGKKISEITGYPRRPAGRPYGSLQDYIDDTMGVFYVCVELCPSVGPYPYPDAKFYTNVWPRARYVMPLVGDMLGAEK